MNIKNKKGMGTTELIIITLGVLFLAAIISLFVSGEDSFIKKGFNDLRNAIRSVPEQDPSERQKAFKINDAEQRKMMGAFQASLEKAAKCIKDFCLEELPNIDRDEFYEEEYDTGSYNLYIEQDGANTKLRLTKFTKLDTQDESEAIATPVAVSVIENTQPCIIQGDSAKAFYETFNNIDKEAPETPDISKINPTLVNSLVVTATIGNPVWNQYQREIGINTKNTEDCAVKPESCDWELFFGRGTESTIYVTKIKRGTTQYLCFFPLSSDLGPGCGDLENNMMDIDCFDTKTEHSIKDNFNKKLLPETYTCSSAQPASTACECGGQKEGDLCKYEVSQSVCECRNTKAKAQYKTDKGTDMPAGEIICYAEAGKGYMIYTTQACTYMLKAKVNEACK